MLKIEEVMKLWQMTDDLKELVNKYVNEYYIEDHLKIMSADESLSEFLEDYSSKDIIEYLVDTYDAFDDILENFSSYDLRDYISNNYDLDDFIEWK